MTHITLYIYICIIRECTFPIYIYIYIYVYIHGSTYYEGGGVVYDATLMPLQLQNLSTSAWAT